MKRTAKKKQTKKQKNKKNKKKTYTAGIWSEAEAVHHLQDFFAASQNDQQSIPDLHKHQLDPALMHL